MGEDVTRSELIQLELLLWYKILQLLAVSSVRGCISLIITILWCGNWTLVRGQSSCTGLPQIQHKYILKNLQKTTMAIKYWEPFFLDGHIFSFKSLFIYCCKSLYVDKFLPFNLFYYLRTRNRLNLILFQYKNFELTVV